MNYDKDMFSRFPILVSELQVLKQDLYNYKSCEEDPHKYPVKWRPKITTIQVAKDLNNLELKKLINFLRSHELDLNT